MGKIVYSGSGGIDLWIWHYDQGPRVVRAGPDYLADWLHLRAPGEV